MKKLLTYLFSAAVLLFSGAAISSCIVNESSHDEGLPPPSISNNNQTYIISFASLPDMKYANIIRLYTTDSSFKSDVEEENIGQVFPDDIKNMPSTFQFYDSYTATGTFYKYKIRYWNGSFYSYTAVSENVQPGLSTSEASISDASLTCEWDEKNKIYTLVLSADINDLPSADFTRLAFLADNEINTKPFTLGYTDEGTTTVSAATAKEIDLQKVLSTEYLNKQISITGVIGIMTTIDNEVEKYSYTRYYWTNKAGVNMTINYTDETGSTANPKDPNSPLFVPSANAPVNDFDFNANLLF